MRPHVRAKILVANTTEDLFLSIRGWLEADESIGAHTEWVAQLDATALPQIDSDLLLIGESDASTVELITRLRHAGCEAPILLIVDGIEVERERQLRAAGATVLPEAGLEGPWLSRLVGVATCRAVSAEPLHQRVFEHVPMGMAILDPTLEIRRANAAFCELAAGPVIGRPITDFVVPDVGASLVEIVAHALANPDTPQPVETLLTRANDQVVLRIDGIIAVLPAQGDTRGLLFVCRDASPCDPEEAHLASLLIGQPVGRRDPVEVLERLRLAGAVIDENGRIGGLSRGAERVLNCRTQDLDGRPWEDMFEDGAREVVRVRRLMRQPRSMRRKTMLAIARSGGQSAFVDIFVEDCPGASGHKIVLFHDVVQGERLRSALELDAGFGSIIGGSERMQEVFDRIRGVAGVDSTVLVTGETGTGKELVARAVHDLSPRRNHPFVAVNCAGLAESLLVSQLFGHRRGSFTGATHDHRGFFESATGGTLFLDEIGDISPAVQTNLLRVLEERAIIRLGDAMPRPIDVRVIAATHRDLQSEIEEGRFRSDLFYRIQVARIGLPALRERAQDIPALASYFLRECRATMEKPVRGIAEEVVEVLVSYAWPGNVRELKSAIEYAMIGCNEEWIRIADLPPEIPPRARVGQPALAPDTEVSQIRNALERAGGSRTEAARVLGVSRSTLYRRMRTLQIG